MDAEKTKILWESFPNLYVGRYSSIKYSLIPFGFECGNGWYDLIYELSRRLEEKIIEIKKQNPPPRFYWIKKKLDNLLLKINYKLFNAFGFKHPVGKKLREMVDFFRPDLGVEYFPCASQVKEKYGTLRFYMTCETEEMSVLIGVAERKSAVTCETCGKPGKRNSYGWITTLCDDCRGFNLEEREKEFEEKEAAEEAAREKENESQTELRQ